jgi:hypothetical protein
MSLLTPPVTVTITIIEADDLPKMGPFNQIDVFCVLKLRSGHRPPQRTQPYPNDAHPIWDETVSLDLPNAHDHLIVEVRNKDYISGATPIGMVEFVLSELPMGSEVDNWYPIVPAQGVRTGARIRIRMRMARTGAKLVRQPSNPVTLPDPGKERPKPFLGALRSPS